MQQVPRATDRRGSLLVRRSIVAAGAAEDAETSSSSGAWQPQDSILEVEPSAGSAPGDLSSPPCSGRLPCQRWCTVEATADCSLGQTGMLPAVTGQCLQGEPYTSSQG